MSHSTYFPAANRTLLLITGLLAAATSLHAQGDRVTSWAPGRGEGDDDVWARYNEIFERERELAGIRHTTRGTATGTGAPGGPRDFEGTGQAIGAQADNVADEIDEVAPAAEIGRVLGIGHSNGGLVLREEDRVPNGGTRRLNAIITVGTPNHGAAIVNSIQTNALPRELERGCRALSAGPSSIGALAVNDVIVRGISSRIFCRLLGQFVITPLVGRQADGQSAEDAAVGSPFLTTLNAAATRTPVVSIHGNEQRPVHWRYLSSLQSSNRDDQRFQHIANIMRGVYATTAVGFATAAIANAFGFNPGSWVLAGVFAYQSAQWVRGERWLANSEQYWLDALACEERTIRQVVTVQMIDQTCAQFLTGLPQWRQCMEERCRGGDGGMGGCIITRQIVTATTTINTSSDGFLCEGTQLFDPFDDDNIYEAEGVNHSDETDTGDRQTFRGNDEMEEIFNEVFNRPDAFGIAERP